MPLGLGSPDGWPASSDVEASLESLKTSLSSLSSEVKNEREASCGLEVRLREVERQLELLLHRGSKEKRCFVQEEAQEELKEEAEEEAHEDFQEYEIGQTLWDAPALIGLPQVGGQGASSLLCLASMVNVTVQIYICSVLLQSSSFINNKRWKDMASAGKRWRHSEAHEWSAVDASERSLASRVCGQDDALSVSGAQAGTLGGINAYLDLQPGALPKSVSLGDGPTGPLLCSVCILLFVVLILKELRSLATSFVAVLSIPRGPTKMKAGSLVAISRPRLAAVMLMDLLRAFVAVALLYTGIMWLSYTESITDLILNAAALGFILDFDEILAETVVPSVVQKFISSIEPLKYRRLPFHVEAVAPLILTLVIVSTCIGALVMPNAADMLAVKDVMCGGNLNFAIQQTGATYITFLQTAAYTKDKGAQKLKGKAVVELVAWSTGSPKVIQYSLYSANKEAFMRNAQDTIETIADTGYCTDMDVFNDGIALLEMPVWFTTIREETGKHQGKSLKEVPFTCADYAEFCPSNGLMRNICPITCGCHDARSSLIFREPTFGCPLPCKKLTREQVADDPCEDFQVANTTSWTRWWNLYYQTVISVFPQVQKDPLYRGFINYKIEQGCNDSSVDPLAHHSFCDESGPFMKANGVSPIRGFCPQLCCNGNFSDPHELCPVSCPSPKLAETW